MTGRGRTHPTPHRARRRPPPARPRDSRRAILLVEQGDLQATGGTTPLGDNRPLLANFERHRLARKSAEPGDEPERGRHRPLVSPQEAENQRRWRSHAPRRRPDDGPGRRGPSMALADDGPYIEAPS